MKLDNNNIKERIKDTLMKTLKIKFIETEDPFSMEAEMPVGEHNAQTMHVLHGGATIALAESVAGVGSNLLCAHDEVCYGIQISANHMSTAKMGDKVRAKGTILHRGKSTHVWNVDVISETTGKLISSVRVTNSVLKRK
ncbi:MAG: PaaI family thioesterase [Dysgonomonas sp.]